MNQLVGTDYLSLRGIERFSDTLVLIYKASLDPDYWPKVLEALSEELGAKKATMLYVSPSDLKFSFTCGFGFDPYKHGIGAGSFRRYLPDDPVAIYGMTHLDEVFSDRLAINEDVILNSAMHRELRQPANMEYLLTTFLSDKSSEWTGLCFFRGSENNCFSGDDEKWLNRYKQHIKNAAYIHKVIAGKAHLDKLHATVLDTIENGLIIVNEDHKIVLSNSRAKDIIENYGLLKVQDGRLCCKKNKENITLKHSIDRALFEDSLEHDRFGVKLENRDDDTAILAVSSRLCGDKLEINQSHLVENESKSYYTASIPQQRHVLITLCTINSMSGVSVSLLQDLFGLTPAESDLAYFLLEGYTLNEAAQSLGRSTGTARIQLHSIFQKTDTHRQAELIKLLMSIP